MLSNMIPLGRKVKPVDMYEEGRVCLERIVNNNEMELTFHPRTKQQTKYL
jgi:hypothetical protein